MVEMGRIFLPNGFDVFIRDLCTHPRYTVAQYDAVTMIELLRIAKKMHRDPADQIIVATARTLDAALMTNDRRIRLSGLVGIV